MRCRNCRLLDHLVGAVLSRNRRHVEAERLGSLEVDHQLELGRQLDGKVGRFCAFERSCRRRMPGADTSAGPIDPVGRETIQPSTNARWSAIIGRRCRAASSASLGPVPEKERLHNQPLRPLLDHSGEGGVEFLRSRREQRLQAHADRVGGCLCLVRGRCACWDRWRRQERRSRSRLGTKFPEQLQSLARQIGTTARDAR